MSQQGTKTDVAIIGAGPYGLSVAAHLGASNLRVRVFGDPMSFWRRNMPSGMFLRSPWSASHLSDPSRSLTLEAFERERGEPLSRPIPLADFVEYGRWFQRQSVPNVDHRTVARLEHGRGEFVLSLDDGEIVRAKAVVIAAGIAEFVSRPHQFEDLPSRLVSHSCEHGDLTRFRNRRVVVVGAGQSALESAAILKEAGALVEVVARAPKINWLGRSAWIHRLGGRLFYAPSDVGPAGVSWLVAMPAAFRRIPRRIQDPLAERCIRAAASGWLVPRLTDVPILVDSTVSAAWANNGHAEINLHDGTRRTADHILLATGYRVDIERYSFIDRRLVADIDRVDGYPRLGAGFESSVAGLYFVGASAAWSFGPLSRFVAGAGYAAHAVARRLVAGGHGNGSRRRYRRNLIRR